MFMSTHSEWKMQKMKFEWLINAGGYAKEHDLVTSKSDWQIWKFTCNLIRSMVTLFGMQ